MATAAGESFHWSLLLNGLDFIAAGLRGLTKKKPSARDLKYSVLHLAAGVEAMLKERLRRQDWRLVFNDPTKADPAALRTGEFKSVGREAAIARLKSECHVSLTTADEEAIDHFARRRNRYQHFEVRDTREAVLAGAADVASVATTFVAAHLKRGMHASEREAYDDVRGLLVSAKAIVSKRLDKIRPEVDAADVVLQCADCRQDALIVGEGARCAFCLYEERTPEQAAMDYLMGPARHWDKDFAEQLSACPECGRHALVEVDVEEHVCFACGVRFSELERCGSCNQWSPALNELDGLCGDCHEAAIERY